MGDMTEEEMAEVLEIMAEAEDAGADPLEYALVVSRMEPKQ